MPKVAGYSWVLSNFVSIVNAASLATTAPLGGLVSGFAGTANSASRSDHQHPLSPARPVSVGFTPGGVVPVQRVGGAFGVSPINRGEFGAMYVMRPDRGPLNVTAVAVNITTAASAGGVIRFGMWRCLPNTGLIDLTSPVFVTGAISSTSTGLASFALTASIPEGLYWAGTVAQGATCAVTGSADLIRVHVAILGGYDFCYLDGITGAFPTSGTINGNGDGCPVLWFTLA